MRIILNKHGRVGMGVPILNSPHCHPYFLANLYSTLTNVIHLYVRLVDYLFEFPFNIG